MLHSFYAKNFYSIFDGQSLDLTIRDTAPEDADRFVRPFPGAEFRVPKVVAIFGANGSGKSALLRVLGFIKWFVCDSVDAVQPKDDKLAEYIPFWCFADERGEKEETCLAVEFDAEFIEGLPRCTYRYEIKLRSSPDAVSYETLKVKPDRNFRRVFERTSEGLLFSSYFRVAKNDPRRESIRPNASLICTFAKFAHPLATRIINSLSSVYSDTTFMPKLPYPKRSAIRYYVDNPEVLKNLNRRIRFMDLGIEDVSIREVDGEPEPYFKHSGISAPLAYYRESHGTQKFFNLFPILNFVLSSGGIAIIDDFDSDIHALLLPEIVRWFHDRETNIHNAQLIMSCHNPTLLEHLEKEEVAFTEKTSTGETQVFTLKEIKGARRDMNLYSKYLGGAFGGIPKIG